MQGFTRLVNSLFREVNLTMPMARKASLTKVASTVTNLDTVASLGRVPSMDPTPTLERRVVTRALISLIINRAEKFSLEIYTGFERLPLYTVIGTEESYRARCFPKGLVIESILFSSF